MKTSARFMQYALVLIAALAVQVTMIQAEHNGFFSRMRDIRDNGPHVLPGTTFPLRKHYTGVGAVDYQLQVLMVFFYEIFSGTSPALTIQCLHFGGQFGAAWLLLILEASRAGSRGTILTFMAIWGLIAQNVSYAITAPIYLATNLGLSKAFEGDLSNISAPASDLAALPMAMILGYLVPSVLLALPSPSFTTLDQKQILNAIWQVFPIWVSLFKALFSLALPVISPALGISGKRHNLTLNLLRTVYVTALLLAGPSHIATVSMTLAYEAVPTLFNLQSPSISFRNTFVPSNIPVGFNTIKPVQTLSAGVHLFLQYDELMGSTAMLLWAVYVYSHTMQLFTISRSILLGAAVIGLVTLLGPVGAATVFLWARDEIVIGARTA